MNVDLCLLIVNMFSVHFAKNDNRQRARWVTPGCIFQNVAGCQDAGFTCRVRGQGGIYKGVRPNLRPVWPTRPVLFTPHPQLLYSSTSKNRPCPCVVRARAVAKRLENWEQNDMICFCRLYYATAVQWRHHVAHPLHALPVPGRMWRKHWGTLQIPVLAGSCRWLTILYHTHTQYMPLDCNVGGSTSHACLGASVWCNLHRNSFRLWRFMHPFRWSHFIDVCPTL